MIIKDNGFGWDIYPFEEIRGTIVRVQHNDGTRCRVQLLDAVPGAFAHPDWWRVVIAALQKGCELADKMNATDKP